MWYANFWRFGGATLGRKRSYHVMDASCWYLKFGSWGERLRVSSGSGFPNQSFGCTCWKASEFVRGKRSHRARNPPENSKYDKIKRKSDFGVTKKELNSNFSPVLSLFSYFCHFFVTLNFLGVSGSVGPFAPHKLRGSLSASFWSSDHWKVASLSLM